jgi:hypothetical protein
MQFLAQVHAHQKQTWKRLNRSMEADQRVNLGTVIPIYAGRCKGEPTVTPIYGDQILMLA